LADQGNIGDPDDFLGQGQVAAVSGHHALNHPPERQAAKLLKPQQKHSASTQPGAPSEPGGLWGMSFFSL